MPRMLGIQGGDIFLWSMAFWGTKFAIMFGDDWSRWGSYLHSPASVGSWQPWWEMFSPPSSMPFYRETAEQLLLVGSFEFQEIRRSLFWSLGSEQDGVDPIDQDANTVKPSVKTQRPWWLQGIHGTSKNSLLPARLAAAKNWNWCSAKLPPKF